MRLVKRKRILRWQWVIGSSFLVGFMVLFFFTMSQWDEWNKQQVSWPRSSLFFVLEQDVSMKDYLEWANHQAILWDSLLPHSVNEYVLIRHNHWIIDSLASKDYYQLKERGMVCLNQPDLVVLHQGDTIRVPDALEAERLEQRIKITTLDINIPEFKLRIKEGDSVIFNFDIRVGRRDTQYLEMAGRTVNLETRRGNGRIIRINKNPVFINPENNLPYQFTTRDDGVRTRLPVAPWLEPEINGKRWGQLIHPTTNLRTIGKAVSHGCIGTREGDIWYIYYYAPLFTPVQVRYDLYAVSPAGDTTIFKDIYKR